MTEPTEKQRILVVDDNTENLDILVSLFKDDYRVAAAREGEKCLKMAEKHPPDLILLDVVMPGLDGYEVCRRLKEKDVTRNIPVIFITALSEAMDEARAFAIGAVDFISKPFQPIVVKARVNTHLGFKKKSDMLESLAAIDGLTNIYNRRKFDETIGLEWRRAARNGKPLSLILFDIDHFKLYNDNYGHARGDECLKKIAEALKNALQRPGDFIGRYGGEEFAAILADSSADGARQVAEKLRQTIVDVNIPHAHSKTAPYVTLSAGVATVLSPGSGESIEGLIDAADKMLFHSKKNGRNQVSDVVINP